MKIYKSNRKRKIDRKKERYLEEKKIKQRNQREHFEDRSNLHALSIASLIFPNYSETKATEALHWTNNQHTKEQHRRPADWQKFVKSHLCRRNHNNTVYWEVT